MAERDLSPTRIQERLKALRGDRCPGLTDRDFAAKAEISSHVLVVFAVRNRDDEEPVAQILREIHDASVVRILPSLLSKP